jgi:hypothetical protein
MDSGWGYWIDMKDAATSEVRRDSQSTKDAAGRATYTSSVAGVFTAAGTARDEKGNEGYDVEEFRFRGADDGTDPIAVINTPADHSKISKPTDIIGTASDDNLVLYELEYSPRGANDFIEFARGTSGSAGILPAVINGVLGRLDPTIMRNGLIDVRLTAEDAGGRTASAIRTYQIEGDMKIGNFTLTFEDMTIPVAGIPITVTRTYDSRNKRKGDFGVGWTLSVSDIQLNESGDLAKGWELVQLGGFIPSCDIQATEAHYVTVTYPDDQVDTFMMTVSRIGGWEFCPALKMATVSFQAAPGTHSSLAASVRRDSQSTNWLLWEGVGILAFSIGPAMKLATSVKSSRIWQNIASSPCRKWWGRTKLGNQGVRHFRGYIKGGSSYQIRTHFTEVSELLRAPAFRLSEIDFYRYTMHARDIVRSHTHYLKAGGGKEIFFRFIRQGKNLKVKDGIIVITRNGKLQTMYAAKLKDFKRLVRRAASP